MSNGNFPAPDHDHTRCRKALQQRAEALCARSGARLTRLRRAVLAAVAESHQAAGAYEVIERMAASGPRPAPISVYRALDFLVDQGLVHKIESCNAFVACSHGEHACDTVLMICSSCRVVAEMDAGEELARLAKRASGHGFTPVQTTAELTGTCQLCTHDD